MNSRVRLGGRGRVRAVTTDPAAATPLERALALRLAQHLERVAAMDRNIAEWASAAA